MPQLVLPAASTPATATPTLVTPVLDTPAFVERRRPGRLENPSPELIALMRKPSAEAVRQVALYDAPNFVLPTPATTVSPRTILRVAGAATLCATACAAVFEVMLFVWA